MAAATTAFMAAMSLNQGIQESQNKKLQGRIQRQIAETNARFAEIQGEDALRRGEKAANEYGTQVKRVIAGQRASFAAQGVEVDSGTAAAIQEETKVAGEEGQAQIRRNAWNESWGFKAQAAGMQSAGVFGEIQANSEARNSLITGGMRALDYGTQSYGEYKKKGQKSGGGST